MFDRIAKNLRLPAVRLASSVFFGFAAGPASAQAPPPVQPAQFDPSDVYFQGYLSIRAAEQLEAAGDFVGAAEKLSRARKLLETVRRYYPDWKPEMVAGRSAQNAEAEIKIHPKAEEQRRKNRNVVAELEGGAKSPGTLSDPGLTPLSPGILEVDPLAARQLAEAEAEVKRLRSLPPNAAPPTADAADLARQRDANRSQLNAAENDVQALRARLAASPVETGMKSLNQRIAGLEQEREAMAMALNQSRSAHT
ncbi:hypothetical protein HQ447_00380, partial [bacterium]|nr:hypothetical protein [bacterium]